MSADRRAAQIFAEELARSGAAVGQTRACLLAARSAAVVGDRRRYGRVVAQARSLRLGAGPPSGAQAAHRGGGPETPSRRVGADRRRRPPQR